jgi:hypothetical protein
MIDVLYNKLGSINDSVNAANAANTISTEWKDVDVSIYNRHSQIPLVPLVPLVQQVPQASLAKLASPVLKENKTITPNPIIVEQPTVSHNTVVSKKTVVKGKKDTTIKPLDIIIKETGSFNISTEYIKESIITLISKEEFSKTFGLTKCAEIMSGVVNNRWNKSTALFISFLLDKEVYYNDKSILYNKEKNVGKLTV